MEFLVEDLQLKGWLRDYSNDDRNDEVYFTGDIEKSQRFTNRADALAAIEKLKKVKNFGFRPVLSIVEVEFLD